MHGITHYVYISIEVMISGVIVTIVRIVVLVLVLLVRFYAHASTSLQPMTALLQ